MPKKEAPSRGNIGSRRGSGNFSHATAGTKGARSVKRPPPATKKNDRDTKPLSVRGRALYSDRTPAAGLDVTATDRDLRVEQELGRAVSRPDGTFEIRFRSKLFEKAEIGNADLIIRVYGRGEDSGAPLAETTLPRNRERDSLIEVIVSSPPSQASEYERIASAVRPLLVGQGDGGEDLAVLDLVASDVGFLASEAGLDTALVERFVGAQLAAKQVPSRKVKRRSASIEGVTPEFFYGLFWAGLGTNIEQLLPQSRSVVESGLTWAIERGAVPKSLEKAKLPMLDAWDRFRAPLAADRNPSNTGLSTQTVLDSLNARVPSSILDRVMLLAAREGMLNEALISELENDSSLGKDERESLRTLRTTIAFATFAGSDAALFQGMVSVADDLPPLSRAADIVTLSREHWMKVAQSLPSATQGTGADATAIARNADELLRRADSTYIAEATQVRLERAEFNLSKEAKAAVLDLTEKHPGLNITGNAGATLAQVLKQATNTGLVSTQAAVELLQLKGLLDSTGSSLDVIDLKASGFHSVGAVVSAGRNGFISKMTDDESGFLYSPWQLEHAEAFFDRLARASESGTIAVIGALAGASSPAPVALSGAITPSGSVTTLSGLAASQGRCACESCRSVLSQAAYLADLLNFLRDAGQTQGLTPLDVLLQRRPDVQEVLLDCSNETTEVSYVDLVNEVLERAVVSSSDPGWLLLARNSSGSAFVTELDQGSLPVSLAAELGLAGVRISQRATVETVIAGVRWRVRDGRWVVDLLNRSASLISPPPLGVRAAPWPQSGTLDDVPTTRHLMGAYEVLAESVYPWTLPFDLPRVLVRSVLSARGFSEEDLRRVFGTGSTDDAADDAAVSRLQLSERELREIAASTALTEADVAQRWGFSDVAAQVDDPSPQFDRAVTRPRLVGWKAIVSRVSFLLDRSRMEYGELLEVLSTAFVNGAGALRIVSVDPADPSTCDLRKLRLDGISDQQPLLAIYRFVRLRRATALSIRELDTLLTSVGASAWPATVKRVAVAIQIRNRLPLPIRDLSVLWANLGTRTYVDASHGDVRSLRSDYEAVFRSTDALAGLLPADPAATTGWPTFDQLRSHLPQALGIGSDEYPAWLNAAGISRTATASLGPLSTLYRHIVLAKALNATVEGFGRFLPLLSEHPFSATAPAVLRAVERTAERWALFSALSAESDAVELALTPSSAAGAELEVRVTSIAQALHERLRVIWNDPSLLREDEIVRFLADLTGQDPASTRELSGRWLRAPRDRQLPANARQSVLAVLNDRQRWPSGSATTPIARASAPVVVEALTLVAKAASLLSVMKIPRRHWGWVFERATSGGWLDLDQLPVKATDPSNRFEQLETLARWVEFWSRRDGAEVRAQAYFVAVAAGTRPAANQVVANELGTTSQQIDALMGNATGNGAWSVSYPAGYLDPRVAERLASATGLAQRLKVDATEIVTWFTTSTQAFPTRLLQSNSVSSALHASLEAPDRARVFAEHAKVLRDQCRHALLELLRHREQIAGTSEIFGRYLIDVEMSSEQRSTRMAQALFATQLFIQRMLMNLESTARLAESDAAQWNQWRKWYRVWEANRKVLLYPENWLEPEFRDDKSQFFRELESDLQQSDLTSDRAMVAFGTYLDKLGQVSRLELTAIHNERDDRGRDVTHLFARTRSGPVSHFYRRRIRNYAWTAWEKIEADVEGDFLIPIVHGKRLQLLWATISEDARSAPGQAGAADSSGMWKVQFARSRRTESGWKAKELIGKAVTYPRLAGKDLRDSFAFRTVSLPSGEVRVLAFVAVERKTPAPVVPPADLVFWTSTIEKVIPTTLELKLVYDTQQDVGIPGVDVFATLVLGPISSRVSLGTSGPDGLVRIVLPPKQSFTAELTFSLNGTDRPWWFLSSDPFIGNYRALLPNGKSGLWVDGPRYQSMRIPVIVSAGSPPASADPSRPVDWQQIEGVLCSPSGAINRSAADVDASLGRPPNTSHRGMGYRPLGSEVHLSYGPTSKGVLTVASGDSLLLGNAHRSGISFRSETYAWLAGSHPDLGFDSPFGVSTSDGAYIGDAYQQPLYMTGSNGSVTVGSLGSITLQSVHYPRDSELLGSWARLQFAALNTPALQREGGSGDASTVIRKSSATSVSVNFVPEGVEFDHTRSSSLYNWEVFLHVPWVIAKRLCENKRYSEAQRWYHTIFDPTLGRIPGQTPGLSAWRCRPLREALERGESLFDLLADRTRLEQQVQSWEDHPFQPHALARYRLRSYAAAILKDYIELLLSWGEDIRRRNTLEAINEATQLFVLAFDLLGTRPAQPLPGKGRRPETFSRLADFDALSNPAEAAVSIGVPIATGGSSSSATPNLDLRYFCIPANDALMDLWARVEGSLQRVRLGAAGSLFGPPIDPAILVRAAAMGLDISDVVAGLSEPSLPYRYVALTQKAGQLCAEVKSLGSALLTAIEKKDAEELSLLRSRHELSLSELQFDLRRKQVAEAEAQFLVLNATRAGAVERLRHFRELLVRSDLPTPKQGEKVARVQPITSRSIETYFDVDARQLGLSRREMAQLQWSNVANNYAMTASIISAVAAIGHFVPNFSWTVTPPGYSISYGGSNVGQGMSAISTVFQALSANASYQASSSATVAGHERRRDEWAYQHNLIAAEIEQLDKQMEAAALRKEIAAAELDYQIAAKANAAEVDQYLRSKFSSAQLYHWMVRQLSGLYFRTYQVALELSKAAQRAFDREMAVQSPSQFIMPGYWDNLREGLLAGERLTLDLWRMDAEYMRKNIRELELTKSVSLAMLDPLALIQLRTTGRCTFRIPEVVFDLDFPGHYLRRIKSVAVSVPCVVGPYAGVPGTLTLSRSYTRTAPSLNAGPVLDGFPPSTTSIATSSGQADAGMFEGNLRDERYLPFEGAGVVDSEWEFKLASDFRAFDYSTISDLILQIRFTALSGDRTFGDNVRGRLKSALNAYSTLGQTTGGLWRAFSLRHEFPSTWAALAGNMASGQVIALDSSRFGALLRDSTLRVNEVRAVAVLKAPLGTRSPPQLNVTHGSATNRRTVVVVADQPVSDFPNGRQGSAVLTGTSAISVGTSPLQADVRLSGLQPGDLEDLFVCLRVELM